MISHKTLNALLFFVGAVVICAGLILFFLPPQQEPTAQSLPLPEIQLLPDSLLARAAILYDPRSKRVLFEKNSSESLPLASLTKLMAAETVLEILPEDLSVVITPAALRPDGDSGLKVGESWLLKDLLLYGLVASSNDAMAAAVGSLGEGAIDAMNAVAARLGMTQTYFLNPTGLDLDVEVSGAYGSARDVAVLAAAFMKQRPEFFEATGQRTTTVVAGERSIEATTTASPLLSIPGFIGAKTGYTDLAGGNLVAAFDLGLGQPLIAVVLGSTYEGRFEDMQTLINAARQTLQ